LRTIAQIERTSGTRESLIHLLMMTEVGVPLTLCLLCEINPLILTMIMCSIAAHEATARWDVSTAEHSGREVTTWEQHVHSFLESMPIMAASTLGCLHWRQVRELLGGIRNREAWRRLLEAGTTTHRYLAAIGAAVVGAIVVPYGEELLRCVTPDRESMVVVHGLLIPAVCGFSRRLHRVQQVASKSC
jgi:hypothetical protein